MMKIHGMTHTEEQIMNKEIEGIDKLLAKYEDIKKRMLVMDDYDGGQMHMVNLIVRDLKKLKKLSLWG